MNDNLVVAVSLLGTELDKRSATANSKKWRPTVSLCAHAPSFGIDRLELLYQPEFSNTALEVEEDVRAISPRTEVRKHPIRLTAPRDFEEVYESLHAFADGYDFATQGEEYLVHITTGTHVAQICLFMLATSRVIPAKLVQTSPPKNRDKSSAGGYEIIDLDVRRYDRLLSRSRQKQAAATAFLKYGIETRNKAFNALIERVEQVAISSRKPLLLTGPTGAGKSRLAQRIYDLKVERRQVAPNKFYEVNCACLRGDMAMSALFGHVKGAFTGATTQRKGLLLSADKGVLFLDEIGVLGMDEQAMLLRAVEQKKFSPMGTEKEESSDFQLIAGTNCDLAAQVRKGEFREDLLARIDHWSFELPGLKERKEDIEPNLDYEIEEYERRTDVRVVFDAQARKRFLRFAVSLEAVWDRSFRDLTRAVDRMATLAVDGKITTEIVDEEIARFNAGWRKPNGEMGCREEVLERVLNADRLAEIDPVDRVQMEYVVHVCKESRHLSEAGRRLYAASLARRTTTNDTERVRRLLAKYDLTLRSIHDSFRSTT